MTPENNIIPEVDQAIEEWLDTTYKDGIARLDADHSNLESDLDNDEEIEPESDDSEHDVEYSGDDADTTAF